MSKTPLEKFVGDIQDMLTIMTSDDDYIIKGKHDILKWAMQIALPYLEQEKQEQKHKQVTDIIDNIYKTQWTNLFNYIKSEIDRLQKLEDFEERNQHLRIINSIFRIMIESQHHIRDREAKKAEAVKSVNKCGERYVAHLEQTIEALNKRWSKLIQDVSDMRDEALRRQTGPAATNVHFRLASIAKNAYNDVLLRMGTENNTKEKSVDSIEQGINEQILNKIMDIDVNPDKYIIYLQNQLNDIIGKQVSALETERDQLLRISAIKDQCLVDATKRYSDLIAKYDERKDVYELREKCKKLEQESNTLTRCSIEAYEKLSKLQEKYNKLMGDARFLLQFVPEWALQGYVKTQLHPTMYGTGTFQGDLEIACRVEEIKKELNT